MLHNKNVHQDESDQESYSIAQSSSGSSAASRGGSEQGDEVPLPRSKFKEAIGAVRSKPTATFTTPYGVIDFYKYPGREMFVAKCRNPIHATKSGAACRCTKSASVHSSRTRIGQGRPLAYLYVWLKQCSTKQNHASHKGYTPSLGVRQQCRDELMQFPGFPEFSNLYERKPRAGEGLEPEFVP